MAWDAVEKVLFGPATLVAGVVVLVATMRVTAEQPAPVEVGEAVRVTGDLPEVPHSEPFVAVDPRDEDHLVVGSIVFPDSMRTRVDAMVSFDGGESWERSRLPGARRLHAVDPWVAIRTDGTVLLTVLGEGPRGRATFLHTSRDGGRTWSEPVLFPPGEGGSQDQGKLTVDTTGGPHAGRAYLAVQQWGPRTNEGESTDAVSLYHVDAVVDSSDPARPSGPMHVRPNNLRKSSWRPVVTSDGSVIQFYSEWRRIRGGPRLNLVWSMVSTDGGATYSVPSLVTDERARSWLSTTVTPAGDHPDRIFVATHYDPGDGRRLRVLHSDDRGARWSDPVVVRTVPTGREAFFLRMDADGRGNVGVAWVEHDPVSEARMCHEWFVAVSTDGGASFGAPNEVGRRSCHALPGQPRMIDGAGNVDPVLPRFGRGGDYFGFAGLPGGGFRMVWAAPLDGPLHLWTAEVTVE